MVTLIERNHPVFLCTLRKTTMAPENRPSQNETSIPTIHFRCYVSFREGNIIETLSVDATICHLASPDITPRYGKKGPTLQLHPCEAHMRMVVYQLFSKLTSSTPLKIICLSKWVICRFHVNLPGCIYQLWAWDQKNLPSPACSSCAEMNSLMRRRIVKLLHDVKISIQNPDITVCVL